MAENVHNYSSQDKICTDNLLNCKIYIKSAIDREKLSALFHILWEPRDHNKKSPIYSFINQNEMLMLGPSRVDNSIYSVVSF